MEKAELTKLMDDVFKSTEQVFVRDGFADPMVFLSTIDNKGEKAFGIVPILKEMFPQRQKMMIYLGQIMGKRMLAEHATVQAIMMVTEGWISQVEKADYENLQKEGKSPPMPSEDPNRKEIVQICGQTSSHENEIRMYEVKKDENGKRILGTENIAEGFNKVDNFLFANFWKGYTGI